MTRMAFWRGGKEEADALQPAAPRPLATTSAAGLTGRSETGLQQEAHRLLKSYEDSNQGWFWATDVSGRLTYISDSIAALVGHGPNGPPDRSFVDLFEQASESSGRTLAFLFTKQAKFDRLTLRPAASADDRWWSVSGVPQFDAGGTFTGYRGSGVDVTEQRRSTAQASQLAMYDSLTGLPNRFRMAQVLATSLTACDLQNSSCAVMLIDLDRFKQVNDTLGHPAGDALLCQVGERLQRIVGDRERVFRLGGDEFQIIVGAREDRGVLGDLANEIITTLSQPYSVNGSRCIIGASVGIAVAPIDGRASEELIRNADLALYAAKGSGRGRFRFFSSELLQAAEDKRALEEDLRDALAKGEIELHYQPIVAAADGITTGVEALVRWNHPERGYISPALFIPIAEEANLIEQLGSWVLRKACEDAASWPGSLRVAVNVSPVQFTNDALPNLVMTALASSGLPPERLELEITEGVFLADSAATDSMFTALKDIGVRLALDDFGTGYSSLGYLRTAPFDKIKIDQSFVRAATLPGSRNRAIIAAIVALAEALGMDTTAEGIESLDQLDLIRDLRVSHVQGYVYSKALMSDEIRHRLSEGIWQIAPKGPAKQRSDRHSMYRSVGAMFGNHYHSILIRNLSESGALIEGLVDVPVDSLLLIDFGEGQLAFARVRRSQKRQQGIEFEQPLVSDGNGGLCTSHRVSPYLLNAAGLSGVGAASGSGSAPAMLPALDVLRSKLGLVAVANRALVFASEQVTEKRPERSPDTQSVEETTDEGDAEPRESSAVPTVAQISGRYLSHVRHDRRRHAIDQNYLHKHILPRFGQMTADELTPSKVAAWLAQQVKEESYAPARVNRLQAILGQIYMLAMQWGLPGSGEGVGQGLANLGRRDDRERALTDEEVERLNEATRVSHNPQLKYIVSLLMLTGTRQRELLKAQWDDVDLKAATWRIPDAKSGKARIVSLSTAAIALINELPRWNHCPHLIANPKTRKPYRSFYVSWETARLKAGLQDLELDDLRHSAPSTTNAPRSSDFVGHVLKRAGRSPSARVMTI